MFIRLSRKTLLVFAAAAVLAAGGIYAVSSCGMRAVNVENSLENSIINWVDFNVSYEAMADAMKADIDSYGTDAHCSWTELLAYLAALNGNDFSGYKSSDLDKITERLESGETMDEIAGDMKYYDYYKEAFAAALGGFIGEYTVQTESEDTVVWEKRYGLKVFCPIAEGFSFEHYDDFANARTYGYARRHMGHDLFGSIGTPVVAIESGIIECVGWNRYGGWRIGIRSFDRKRYYYYAHLRKDHPYTPIVKEGAEVMAGDVIGYLGMTGYSETENVNNINVPHLHMGIELVFDESQKESDSEIWIDCYDIAKLLMNNRCAVVKNENTGEYERRYGFYERVPGE